LRERSRYATALVATVLVLVAQVGTAVVTNAGPQSRLHVLERRVADLGRAVAHLEAASSFQSQSGHTHGGRGRQGRSASKDDRIRRLRRQLTRLDFRIAAMEATTSAHQRVSVASQPERVDLDRHQGRVLRQLSRWTGRLERRVAELARVGVVPPAVTCPVGATSVTPAVNLVAAVQAAGVGASLCLKPGVYRLSGQVRPLAGQTITLERGAIVSGAKIVNAWTKQGTYWVLDKQTQDFSSGSALAGQLCTDSPTACIYEDLYRDGRPLQQVNSLAAVGAGKVFFDKALDKMFIVDDPTGHTMEATTVTTGIASGATGVTIRGGVIEKMGWLGVQANGAHWTIENCEIRYSHGTGLRLIGNDYVVRGNFIHHNGNSGIVATAGSRLLVVGNELAFNNYLHFGAKPVPHQEGGAKFLNTSNVVLRDNYSHDNDGDGWWFDTDNINITVENNRFESNSRHGFLYEVSYDAVIRNNVFKLNATDAAWMGSGLRIASSKNVEVSGNLFENNRFSTLTVNSADRGSGKYGLHETTGLNVHDNVFKLSNGYVGASYGLAKITSAAADNRFLNNDYVVPDVSKTWWMWGPSKRIGWAGWRGFGFDLDGSVTVG
jgi:hypothetical protein